jgi:hypothetical protein
MQVRRWRIGILIGLAAATTSLCVTSADAAVSSPHIKAQPNNVMVNTSIALTGVRFRANSTFTIKECSTTAWIAPQNLCSANTAVLVTTNNRGRFQASFKAEVCANGQRGKEPTSVICYIGKPQPTGVDTVSLVGAAKITVTYP